jgi:hypothetical protein
MTYFADLAPCTYFRGDATWLLAVGWLEATHPYPRGPASAEDITALERLALETWQPMFSKGWHDCSLCGKTSEDEPIVRSIGTEQKLLGVDNIFVPQGDVMYVAPTLVLHCIDTHGYRPPEEFLRAVRLTDPARPEYIRECERLWGQ